MLKTICQIMIASMLMLPNQESTERIYIPIASVKGVENEERLFEIQEELEHLTTENTNMSSS